MANSRTPGPEKGSPLGGIAPARTPGSLGKNDAADPNCSAILGDTAGPLGFNDGAAACSTTPYPFLQPSAAFTFLQNAISTGISSSVGKDGVNMRRDVMFVQQLINSHLPIPLRPLKVDGTCGPFTIAAIEEIQRRNLHMDPADGKVDPNGATFRFLMGEGVPAPKKPAAASGPFPAAVIAGAQASEKTWKIPAAITLAQWALESNWGKAMPPGSNNPFGIKAKAGEPYVEANTHEVIKGKRVLVVAKFRKFASLDDAFDQHGRLLATAGAYAHARTLISNPDAFADALTGVYATDPSYGTKLKTTMKAHNLYQYD